MLKKNRSHIIAILSVIIFGLCVYSFLLGNGIFAGKFENEPMAWYFLAKGIFCSTVLYLTALILERLHKN